MTRTTRSNSVKCSVNEVTKEKNKQIKLNNKKKVLEQDENALPPVNNSQISAVKNLKSKPGLGSKLHAIKEDSSSVRKTNLLEVKSPALRDRTNTTNKRVKVDMSKKKEENLQSTEKKNLAKRPIRKVNQNFKNVEIHLNTLNTDESDHEKVGKALNLDNPDAKKNSKTLVKYSSNTKQNIDTVNKNSEKPELNKNTVSQNINKRKRQNDISIEEMEKLLNQDNEEMIDIQPDKSEDLKKKTSKVQKVLKPIESGIGNKNNAQIKLVPDKNINFDNKESVNEVKDSAKKFFKYKGVEDVGKASAINKKNPRRKVNVHKKDSHNDSTFVLELKEHELSPKPVKKKLRPRTVKNYCEQLRQSQSSDTITKEISQIVENHTDIPIYKTLKLSQDNLKNKEEIYDFPDDSQENNKKSKKRKVTIKKSTNKRVKKTSSKPVKSRKTAKPNKNVSRTVHFNIENNTDIGVQENVLTKNDIQTNTAIPENALIKNHMQTNTAIPEHLQNAGDSTIQEASTIKIISNEILKDNEKISLTETPSAPKTMISELKYLGQKNLISVQYNNLMNHSLIRKSMSPITAVEDNFNPGSPWRPIDVFPHVKKIIHSTPQISRVLLNRGKKLPVHVSNLNKKSISSEDTILISSSTDDTKLLLNKNNSAKASPEKANEKSPRKFGTVISNLDSSLIKTTQTSPLKTVSPLIVASENNHQSFKESISDQHMLNVDVSKELNSKENTMPSPQKSSKKNSIAPSPFRFEKTRSSKRIASAEYQSKTTMSTIKKENKDIEPKLKNSTPTVLRQSNLNNFLNLDEMPESTRISTVHGIFDDSASTPISGKKPRNELQELNIENAFGFDDDINEMSPLVRTPNVIIATKQDVQESVKGKLFLKARVKSSSLKTVLKRKPEEIVPEVVQTLDKNNSNEIGNDKIINEVERNYKPIDPKTAVLKAESFSDTFDISESEQTQSKIPTEIPLFVDLEPVHFSQPPRRSYGKRKRAICFDTGKDDFENDEEEHEKPKLKKKKESKLSKQEQKRMQDWVKNINQTFDEIEHFDLVVE